MAPCGHEARKPPSPGRARADSFYRLALKLRVRTCLHVCVRLCQHVCKCEIAVCVRECLRTSVRVSKLLTRS